MKLRYLPFIGIVMINTAFACEEKAGEIDENLSGLKIEATKSYECDLVVVSGPAHMKGFPKLDKLVLVLKGRDAIGTPYFSTYINTTQEKSGEQSGGVCVNKNDVIELDIEVSYTSSIGTPKCNIPSYTYKNVQQHIVNL